MFQKSLNEQDGIFHLTDTLINFHLDPGLHNLAQNEQQNFKNDFFTSS